MCHHIEGVRLKYLQNNNYKRMHTHAYAHYTHKPSLPYVIVEEKCQPHLAFCWENETLQEGLGCVAQKKVHTYITMHTHSF